MEQPNITPAAELELEALVNQCLKDLGKSRTSDGIDLILGDYQIKWNRLWATTCKGMEHGLFLEKLEESASRMRAQLPRSQANRPNYIVIDDIG